MIFTRVTFLNEGEQAEKYKRKKAEEQYYTLRDKMFTINDRRSVGHGYGEKEYNGGLHPQNAVANKKREEEAKRIASEAEEKQRSRSSEEGNNAFRKQTDAFHKVMNTHDRQSYGKAKSEYDKASLDAKKKIGKASDDDLNQTYNRTLYADAINKDMRRHPDRWKEGPDGRLRRESSIFESVTFLNDSSFEDIKKQREKFYRNHDDRMKSVKDALDSFNKTRENEDVKSDNEEELNSISAKLKALKQ